MAFPLRVCSVCYATDAPPHRPMLHVITADGVSHAMPAAWFADRRAQLEHDGVPAVDAIRGAYVAWAATCARVVKKLSRASAPHALGDRQDLREVRDTKGSE